MRLFRNIPGLLYGIIVLGAAIVFFKKSNANWDLIAYTACVLQIEYPAASPADIHSRTFATVQGETMLAEFHALTDSRNPYRLKAFTDPGFFDGQLIFYEVKPGYNLLNLVFKKITGSYRKGIALTSVLGWVLVAILLPLWLRKSLAAKWAFPLSLVILFLPYIFTAARMAAPDMISTAIIVWACYAIFHQRPQLAMLLLALSVFFRPDNNIYAGFLMAFIWLEYALKKTRIWVLVSLLIVAMITIWVMGLGGGMSTLGTMFHGSYTNQLSEALRTIYESFLPMLVVFTVILFAAGIFSIREKEGRFALLIILITCAKFLLIPSLENRFFLPLLVLQLLTATVAITQKIRNGNRSSHA